MAEKRLSVVVLEQVGDDPETARPLVASDDHEVARQCADVIARRLRHADTPAGPQLVRDAANLSPAASRAQAEQERQAREREREREEYERETRWLLELFAGNSADPGTRIVWTDAGALVEEFAPRIRAAESAVTPSGPMPALLALQSVDARNPRRRGPLSGARTTDAHVVADFCRRILAGTIDDEGRSAVEAVLREVEAVIQRDRQLAELETAEREAERREAADRERERRERQRVEAERQRVEAERARRRAEERAARERERHEAEAAEQAVAANRTWTRQRDRERGLRDERFQLRTYYGGTRLHTDLKSMIGTFHDRIRDGEAGPETGVAELDFGETYTPPGPLITVAAWQSHQRSCSRATVRDFCRAFLAEESLATPEEREAAEAALAALEAEEAGDA